MTVYAIQNRWGGDGAPWHEGGIFNIGNRPDQKPIALKIESGDGGTSFSGTMTYQGEDPISVRATLVTTNCYRVENHWGGEGAPWHEAGLFLLGSRNGQNAVYFDLKSDDGGDTLNGTMRYQREGDISVKGAVQIGAITYNALNHWSGAGHPWHPGGQWVAGNRGPTAPVTALNVKSDDQGRTLAGTMSYLGDGPLQFRGTLIAANTYSVVNRTYEGESWLPGGTWVLGCRTNQNAVLIEAAFEAGIEGKMKYEGEGPIGLKLEPSVQIALADA
ncbi:lectin OAA family protein [Sphingomonas pokkalii]|uniref:Lectin ESA-2 n=1 Tax=Sphingomonas pokkalii TaxID=2175090 RepID=A0A2U0SBC2_9SPHN|nr:lectin ESA-2 [Sphingomonas pokkalii]PVX28682.1 lectin ESA-2 [Sphingomonas pokkalii]